MKISAVFIVMALTIACPAAETKNVRIGRKLILPSQDYTSVVFSTIAQEQTGYELLRILLKDPRLAKDIIAVLKIDDTSLIIVIKRESIVDYLWYGRSRSLTWKFKFSDAWNEPDGTKMKKVRRKVLIR